MAQELTVTINGNPFLDGRTDTARIMLDWKTGASDGAVSLAVCTTFITAQAAKGPGYAQPKKIKGYLRFIETIPGLNGNLTTTLPTALYDITLLDAYSYDVAAGSLNDRSGTAAERVVPSAPIFLDTDLTLTIAAAGNSTTGRIIMEVTPEP